MLAVFRFILGLGMGGEWNAGATLVAETWPDELRAKAISVVQSSWAIGFALAALVSGIVLRYASWRYVFFVGILPALITLWIQNRVPESEMWKSQRQMPLKKQSTPSLSNNNIAFILRTLWLKFWFQPFFQIFRAPYLKSTVALLLLNFFGMFGWWGLFTWLPPYLSLPVEQGGRGFGVMGTTTLLVVLNLFGMFPGYLSFGWVADHLGRQRSFMLYTFMAAMLVPPYAMARSPGVVLVLGTVVAFFGTGMFSGSGIIASEIFPTRLRARALGFTYNGARTLSSIAPYVIGRVGQARGLSWAFYLCGAGFALACLMATQLPETKGKKLE
jgi:MFS family permease